VFWAAFFVTWGGAIRHKDCDKTNLAVSVNTLHPWCVNVREWLINISKEANTQVEALWNLFLILVGTEICTKSLPEQLVLTRKPHRAQCKRSWQGFRLGLQLRFKTSTISITARLHPVHWRHEDPVRQVSGVWARADGILQNYAAEFQGYCGPQCRCKVGSVHICVCVCLRDRGDKRVCLCKCECIKDTLN